MWWKLQKLLMLRPKQLKASKKMVVLISGCDSGIGMKIASAACNAGLTVVAGLLGGPEGEGARILSSGCAPDKQPHLVQLDITDKESVSKCIRYVEGIIEKDPQYFLHAVINNAGIMIFGKFEWQTDRQIEQQVNVNILGTWRLSKESIPLLRDSVKKNISESIKPRLITLESHCGIQPLPLLAPYGATKWALRGWTEALTMEMKPTGIHVVSIIPGSFPVATRIAEKQKYHSAEMKNSFTEDQWKTHKEDFDRLLTNFLDKLSYPKGADGVKDDVLAEKALAAILDSPPDSVYKHQPWRYAIYHLLFVWTPSRLRHWLVDKFLMYPKK